jgi:hypothetical protein
MPKPHVISTDDKAPTIAQPRHGGGLLIYQGRNQVVLDAEEAERLADVIRYTSSVPVYSTSTPAKYQPAGADPAVSGQAARDIDLAETASPPPPQVFHFGPGEKVNGLGTDRRPSSFTVNQGTWSQVYGFRKVAGVAANP